MYVCNTQVFNLQCFERERVYTRDELFNKGMHLSAVNLHNWCPSSISTPEISHVTENGQWLGINKKGNHPTHIGSFKSKWKKKNTTINENNDGEIRAYKNNYHSYNGGSENDNGRDTGW